MKKSPNSAFRDKNIMAKIHILRANYPDNLMARYFDEGFVEALNASQYTKFMKIIASGLENPESHMGVYAQNIGDYDEFERILDPMIRDHHDIPLPNNIRQQHDWENSAAVCDLGNIDAQLKDVSMRVRVGRNLSNFPLPGAMTQAQRLDLEAVMVTAFARMQAYEKFAGNYFSLSPDSPDLMDQETYQHKVQSHQMFKDMSGDPYLASSGISADWPYGRGMYISNSSEFIVWVGEEDHLRIMFMRHGGNLSALFADLHDGLEHLAEFLPTFAHSQRYGYITSCPTNLGTAMRASLHLPLPRLTKGGRDIEAVKQVAATRGLSVRGVFGEHSDAGSDGLVDISPNARLGATEADIMMRLYAGVEALWSQEKAA